MFFVNGACVGAVVAAPFGPLALWAAYMQIVHGRLALFPIALGVSIGDALIAFLVIISAKYLHARLGLQFESLFPRQYVIGTVFVLIGALILLSCGERRRMNIHRDDGNVNASHIFMIFFVPFILTAIQPVNFASVIALFAAFRITDPIGHITALLSGFFIAAFFVWSVGVALLAHLIEKAGLALFYRVLRATASLSILIGSIIFFRALL